MSRPQRSSSRPSVGTPWSMVYGGRELFPHNMPFLHSAVVTHVTCPGTRPPNMAVRSGCARAFLRHGLAVSRQAGGGLDDRSTRIYITFRLCKHGTASP